MSREGTPGTPCVAPQGGTVARAPLIEGACGEAAVLLPPGNLRSLGGHRTHKDLKGHAGHSGITASQLRSDVNKQMRLLLTHQRLLRDERCWGGAGEAGRWNGVGGFTPGARLEWEPRAKRRL